MASALAPPVQVVASGAPPFVHVPSGAPPFVAVSGNAPPITIVAEGAPPITLFNEDGSIWTGGAETTPVGGAALLVDETDGFATDFTHATDAERVAVKTAGSVAAYAINDFYQNGGTSPKMVWDAAGNLGWSSHNMALQSQAFDQTTPWNPSTTVTVTANATTAPDGTLTADRLVETATVGQHNLLHSNISVITGETYTYSVYAKAGERNWLAIAPANVTAADWFDLTNGTVGTSANAGAITDAGNGWYRCAITAIAPAATRAPVFFIRTADGQTATYAGDITKGLYLWGAQVNRGSTPLPYFPTTTAARHGLAVDYDPLTHAAKGLLVEQAATNILLNSATLSTQTVSVTGATYTLSFWGTGTVTLSGTSTAGPLVGTGVNDRVSLTFVTSAGSLTLTVTGTATRAQLEINPHATSPIPTFAATATRAADNYTFLLSTIPALGAEYSIYERFATPFITNARHAVVVTDGTVSEFAGFAANTTARLAVVDGGVAVGAIVGPTLVANTPVSAAARIKLNDLAMSVGGAAVGTDATVTLPTPTEVRFGNVGSNAVATASFYVEKLVIATARGWSNAELATKSAA